MMRILLNGLTIQCHNVHQPTKFFRVPVVFRRMIWHSKSAAPPDGYTYGPPYPPTFHVTSFILWAVVRGKRRSMGRDTSHVLTGMPVAPLIRGANNIPEDGRLVVVANHYERPGLWMAWPALFVANCVYLRRGEDVHWIAIETWDTLRVFGVPISRTWIRKVFKRAFGVWSMIGMPRRDDPASNRALALRAATHEVRAGHVIGMMPEGEVGSTPQLLPAREGSGAFLLLMAAAGARILPVGIYEENDRMVAHFGEPYELRAPRDIAKEERDTWARTRVMCSIRDMLPRPLWGYYSQSSGALDGAVPPNAPPAGSVTDPDSLRITQR